ncbi:protein SHQ1-like isoform X2 [Leptotrombidium deliense]|uniref:Protein SHQ1 homolog n=1 Tax=Leptotrombidium deliense TaxID=299467 RepID=A0A443S2X2_9ACAR|nr:protein SHQ1-like isoform X2 [Leptotrombidium deliense]
MLTPAFKLSQDDDYLFVDIKAPHAKVSETEIDFFDRQFRFYSKPYFLRYCLFGVILNLTFTVSCRLALPGRVIQNGDECVKWIADKNVFHVKVPKVCQGQHFEGLDMITKLLTVSDEMKAKRTVPGIEVVSTEYHDEVEQERVEEEEDFNWLQTEWSEKDDKSLLGEYYGFASKYAGVFARMADELACLVDIREPEKKSIAQRRQERHEIENKHFSDDHYLADLHEETEIPTLIATKLCWDTLDCSTEFTDDEKFKLKNLPWKQYLIDKNMKYHLVMGMVDILYAFAYETRVTEGEYSVESGWTITKLSSTLCWLELFNSLQETVVACVRRSLCYPLHRNWQLSIKIIQDVIKILEKGRSFVLKCFLRIHSIFNESGESRYILNDLYITDYCVWLQTVKTTTFSSLAEALKKVNVAKDEVNFDIDILEVASKSVLNDEKEYVDNEENIQLLRAMNVKKQNRHTNEESSEEESEESLEESSESENEDDSEAPTSNDEESSSESEDSSTEDETEESICLNTDKHKRSERIR